MNTFAIIALAWLLYLATKGKLVEFADLAVKSSTNVTTSPPSTSAAP